MKKNLLAALMILGVSIVLTTFGLVSTAGTLHAVPNCGVGQPQCGCPDAVYGGGAWWCLSSWECSSGGGYCSRSCNYSTPC